MDPKHKPPDTSAVTATRKKPSNIQKAVRAPLERLMAAANAKLPASACEKRRGVGAGDKRIAPGRLPNVAL